MADIPFAVVRPITGEHVYSRLVRRSDRFMWNGSALASIASTTRQSAGIALTEQGTSGIHVANMPNGVGESVYDAIFSITPTVGVYTLGDTDIGTYSIPWLGTAIFDPGSTPVTLPAIPNNWITAGGVAAGALNAKGDWITSAGNVQYLGAMNILTGTMTIFRGDDYYLTDNRALTLNAPVTSGSVPDLTGAVVTAFFLSNFTSPARLDLTITPVTVLSPGGSSQQLQMQPTRPQTLLLISGSYTVAFQAVLADGHYWTFIPSAQATVKGLGG